MSRNALDARPATAPQTARETTGKSAAATRRRARRLPDLADQLASIVDSDDERDTLEFALAYQARRRREKKERREQNAKMLADFSRSQWKKGTRRKKVESPDDIVATKC